ncbi:nucleotidyltransferase [bacterium 1xD42-62]|uniref:Nucleotidyltransferase n=2 Tax=Parablautia muri TaxID=2320879 RepID=A0A9X5BEG3_9FIRM|nr:nucleotidyltransferase [Parablautia muri]
MQKIDRNNKGILYIVDKDKRMLGSLTDGDIRRWIIKTGDLNGKAKQVMYTNTKYLLAHESKKAQEYMSVEGLNSVPILDSNRIIEDIIFYNNSLGKKNKNCMALSQIPVIIMAGGKGTRLYPYTKILPKPLIPIGDIPILERIIGKFRTYGVNEFYLTINYKKEMIKSYFNEINPDYTIHYIEENIPLGTAGSIELIKEEFNTPIIVSNCDTLIEDDYEEILKYHKESGNALTIVSALKNTIIPYGVIHSQEQGIISSIEEKPSMSYFINTGMYVINPEHLKKIPRGQIFHMTDLAEQLITDSHKVGMFPISENSFLDMGEFEEMKKMEDRINHNFTC